VVHLHDLSGDLEAEALVAALGTLVVGQHLDDTALDGDLSGPAGGDRSDQGVVVGLWVAAPGEHPCQQQQAERGDAAAGWGLDATIVRPIGAYCVHAAHGTR